jgi:tRNA(Ile)-lysidine synthase
MSVTLRQKVLHAIQQRSLCQRNDCLIVGVSGGADSVALLDLLTSLPDFPLTLIIAHLNHQLRDEESTADEQFVRERAAHYQLSCEIRHSDIRQLARQQHMTLEEAGRTARYRFFEELRQQYHAVAVAVAHHADDQAETFLLRLLRGAGNTGLAAMAPVTQARIIRPLLELTRQELRDYLAEKQLTFREDSSNADCSYLRNRIRHELLPLLQDYNPAISQRLTATASLLGDDEALLNQCTDATFNQQETRSGSGWTALSLPGLKREPRALRMRLYRKVIESILGNLQRFELLHYQLLDKLLQEGTTGNRLDLPCGLMATLTAGHLLLAQNDLLRPASPRSFMLDSPGCYELGNGLSLTVDYAQPPSSWRDLPGSITYVDPDQAPFPWQIRPVLPGERLELLGMRGSRAIQDILTDLKLPRHLRACLPLICHTDYPLWLAGIRRTRYALVQPGEKQALRIILTGQDKLPLFP